jgi:hypothetical protein
MSDHPTPALLVTLGRLQAQRPWHFVIVALLTLIPCIAAILGLGYREDLGELLPEGKDSVLEARRVNARLPGAGTLTVVIQTKTPKQKELQAFVDRLLPKLSALGPEWVGTVDWGIKDRRAFFERNKLLFAEYDDLKKARDEIVERYDYEVSKQAGTIVDEDAPPPPPITAESIKRRLRGGKEEDPNKKDPYPGGYYVSADDQLAAVLVRTPVSGKKKVDELKRKIAAAITEAKLDDGMEVHYTGGLITGAEDFDAIIRDLGEVGAGGVAGVLLVVTLFFFRIRTVFIMGATILVGLAWTFGLTRFTIGYLNTATGFLISIIAGNGINYGIVYMARYLEARRDDGADPTEAVAIAHRDTWVATISAAATSMFAYGSLILTDFRGFKHFGVIGGYGMILCWLATYLFTPAILVASERVSPAFKPSKDGTRTKQRGYYGVAFAKLATFAPRTLTTVGAVIGVASVFFAVKFFRADPMEYDMNSISNADRAPTAARQLQNRVDDIVGRLGQDGLAIMVDRLDQIPMLEKELVARRDAAPKNAKPFQDVVTIYTLLPKDQLRKLPLVNEMRDRILRAKKRGMIADKDWTELSPEVPADSLKEIGIADLPEQVARAFTEVDGTRGRIVYIVPAEGESVWDARYLMRWADSFRYVKLPTGEVIKGSGQSVIYADMIRTIGEDAPKAIIACSLGTILVIIIAFRGKPQALGVFIPWLVGVSGLIAYLQLKAIHLNFLNFIAIPITIGIGAEYAHNLMQRYRTEGDGNLQRVIVETGGAVVLCSLTTTIGYLALLWSINRGIVSLGRAAAVGEITCVLAAVLFLPAFLVWRAKRRAGTG